MSHFVRASKYRHVFVEQPKTEDCFTDFRLSTAQGEQNYIAGNTKFFAIAVQGGGGPFAVVPYGNVGRWPADGPVVSGHKAAVLDLDFNPFHEHVVASASDDSTVKVWGIPVGGLTENIVEPLVDLHGHGKKVTLLKFHPTTANVLASTSADLSVRIWDIEKGVEAIQLGEHTELIQDLKWDHFGAFLATTCKDKSIRIFDVRQRALVTSIVEAHEGAKSSKITYLGESGNILSVGFNKQSMRQLKLWDPRNISAPLKRLDIDQAAGAIMPFFDPDSNLLYLAGKGDGNIRYYEISTADPYCFAISEYRSTVAAKGITFIPKRGLDVMKCETARALKLTGTTVEPLSFVVPRKSDAFQEDIFPPTFSGISSQTADEWFSGSTNPPVYMSLDPSSSGGITSTRQQTSFVPAKTAMQLQGELDVANARIAELEAKLAEAGLS